MHEASVVFSASDLVLSALIGASVSAGEEQQKLPVLLPCRVSPQNSGSK